MKAKQWTTQQIYQMIGAGSDRLERMRATICDLRSDMFFEKIDINIRIEWTDEEEAQRVEHIRQAALRIPLQDIEKTYKEVREEFSKFIREMDTGIHESYKTNGAQ